MPPAHPSVLNPYVQRAPILKSLISDVNLVSISYSVRNVILGEQVPLPAILIFKSITLFLVNFLITIIEVFGFN